MTKAEIAAPKLELKRANMSRPKTSGTTRKTLIRIFGLRGCLEIQTSMARGIIGSLRRSSLSAHRRQKQSRTSPQAESPERRLMGNGSRHTANAPN